MKPLRLRAQGFRTFADLDLTFSDGLVGILGELRDAPAGADSNGAGKSSVLLAIDAALFGGRNFSGFLTRGGETETMTVELEFAHANERYRVRRSYSARGRGKTVCDFEIGRDDGPREAFWHPLTRESIKETDAAIVETINLTRATYRESGYLKQNAGSYADPARDPKERLELLVEAALGRNPVWPRAQEAAKNARRETQAALERLAGETRAARELLATKEDVEHKHRVESTNEQALTTMLSAAERELQDTVERYQAARDAAALRQVAEAEARAAIDAHIRNSEQFKAATAAAEQLADKQIELEEVSADADLVDELALRLDGLRQDAALAQSALGARATLTAEADQRQLARDRMVVQAQQHYRDSATLIEKADHLFDYIGDSEKCERCGQTLGREAAERAAKSYGEEASAVAAKAAEITIAADQELATLAELRNRAEQIAVPAVEDPTPVERELAAARAAAEQRAVLAEVIRQLTERASYREQLQADLSVTAEAVADKQAALDAIEPVDLEPIELAGSSARANVARLRGSLDEAKVQRGRLDEKLAALAKAAEALAAAKILEVTLQASVDVEAVLEKACGRAGIPTLILEAVVIPTLEAKAAHILAELGTGYRVELRTQKANADGGLRDTCEAVVIDETGEAPYEDFSGGEQTRIGLALQIALAEFLATRPGAESSFLALDEPSYLDAAGMGALLGVLRDLIARRVFDSVLLVSHVPELRDELDEAITVVKEAGRSQIAGAREQVAA